MARSLTHAFLSIQGSFFFLLPRGAQWWGLALWGANVKRTGGLRVRNWQEIPSSIDFTAWTVPQQALFSCPLSICLVSGSLLLFHQFPEGGTRLINAPPRISRSPMEEGPWTTLLMALPFSTRPQEITSNTYSNYASVTFRKYVKHAAQLSAFDNYLRLKA